jgi:hypothetical protein
MKKSSSRALFGGLYDKAVVEFSAAPQTKSLGAKKVLLKIRRTELRSEDHME